MSKIRNKKPSMARCYDVEMIKDFLDHLTWEMRARHLESTGVTQTNPELVEMLAKHVRKRQTVGLLAVTALAEPPRPEILKGWNDAMRRLLERQIHCIESLAKVLDEAMECAKRPKTLVVLVLTPDQFEFQTRAMEDEIRLLDGQQPG